MAKTRKHSELREKILKGLDKTYERLIEFKKLKGTDLVVIRDGEIVRITPE